MKEMKAEKEFKVYVFDEQEERLHKVVIAKSEKHARKIVIEKDKISSRKISDIVEIGE